jgi:hypothetical protein
VWVERYEAGALDEAKAADLLQAYEARMAALERRVGKQGLELEFPKGRSAPEHRRAACLPPRLPAWGISVGRGCQLMRIARSTDNGSPPTELGGTATVDAAGTGRRPLNGREHRG